MCQHILMTVDRRLPCLLLPVLLVHVLLATGCAEPPDKEINQAQGAIDAAVAAGADKYAAEEHKAAVTALHESHEAVRQRDYRLALNRALDARERGQEAAGQAAAQKAIVRGEVERALNAISTTLEKIQEHVRTAKAARIQTQQIAQLLATVETAELAVQEARTALEKEDYLAARQVLDGVGARLEQAERTFGVVPAARPARRRG